MSLLTAPKHVNVNTPKFGDILVSSSGYEASISSFAKVIKVSKSFVHIQYLKAIRSNSRNGGMDWDSMPDLEDKIGLVDRRKWSDDGTAYRVKNNSYSSFYVWNGLPQQDYNHH